MGIKKRQESGVMYLSIIAGRLMQKSDKDNPEAVKREYEDKEGNLKSKYEIQYDEVSGFIAGIEFSDSDFGEQCAITIVDGLDKFKIYTATNSRYFTDFAKKLPNVDLSKAVSLSPYDFEGENGKQVKGLGVKQDGEKVFSFYYDADKKKTVNGLPQPDKNAKAEYDSDDWKMYFIKEKKFLKGKVQKVVIPTVNPTAVVESATATSPQMTDNQEEVDDLPF